ncbi:YfbU family protein [Cobetia sp. MMG027]|uniref:YfbU family protein n=1 Tax=Cobetia sp. MMG027 TaxID=3021980 RepID=UPI0022FEE3B6|nr:YfbU family protein [Cobetia sp. MMG027]MDA5564354.1 YfbU family protein [Cobetia sp. MMG027]
MKFSDEQKLIVLMLADLYNSQKNANIASYELDPNFIKEAIFSNNTWAIPWRFPGIEFSNNEPPEYIRELFDILDMWSSIENKQKKLGTEKTHKILINNEIKPIEAEFIGFSSMNEGEYITATRFIIEELERFTQFKGRYLVSQWDTLSRYRRMLKIFENIPNSNLVTYNEELSEKNFIELLKA